MNLRRSLLIQGSLWLASVVLSITMGSRLPDLVPTTWGLNGEVVSMSDKWTVVAMFPALALGILGLSWALSMAEGKADRTALSEETSNAMMVLFAVALFGLHASILFAAGQWIKTPIRPILLTLCITLFGLSVIVRRLPPEALFGATAEWARKTGMDWKRTHDSTAMLWQYGSLVGAILTVVGVPVSGMIAFFLILGLIPIARAIRTYRLRSQ